jgi:hypothetical protein
LAGRFRWAEGRARELGWFDDTAEDADPRLGADRAGET